MLTRTNQSHSIWSWCFCTLYEREYSFEMCMNCSPSAKGNTQDDCSTPVLSWDWVEPFTQLCAPCGRDLFVPRQNYSYNLPWGPCSDLENLQQLPINLPQETTLGVVIVACIINFFQYCQCSILLVQILVLSSPLSPPWTHREFYALLWAPRMFVQKYQSKLAKNKKLLVLV